MFSNCFYHFVILEMDPCHTFVWGKILFARPKAQIRAALTSFLKVVCVGFEAKLSFSLFTYTENNFVGRHDFSETQTPVTCYLIV